jgi:hypothetical protein
MDYGFYFLNQAGYPSYKDTFSKFLDPQGNGYKKLFSNVLIRSLLKNEEFKQNFIKRFVYHCTVTFEPNRVLQRIDELVANIEPYMQRDKDKWHYSNVAKWKSNQIALLQDFAKQRPEMNLNYMQKYFNLSDTEMKQLTGS